MNKVKAWAAREPVIIRTLVVAAVALVATLWPDMDVDNVTGFILTAITLAVGGSVRAKVSPAE